VKDENGGENPVVRFQGITQEDFGRVEMMVNIEKICYK